MEIKREKSVEKIIGEMKTNKFKIGEDSMGIIIDSLINLYSDPIGSIVREVTSNCYDAHREKRFKRMGTIPSTHEDVPKYWHDDTKCPQIEFQEENILLGIGNAMIFRDFGIGLSQQRVETIYTMFGNSTKRDNNLQIGGFGIGAKSPFSYTNTFYIIANHNGVKHSYMLYKGNDAFHMDMIKATPTEDLNSTEVIIPIQEDKDLRTFKKSIEQQLLYFEGLQYINVDEGLGAHIDSIKIDYEDDDLIVALGLEDTHIDKNLHCVVGRVRYPLDFNQLDGIDEDRAPAALKFAIGEIDLVPSRENIRYTDRTKEAIKAKFKAVKDSCVLECNKELSNATDFLHWIQMATAVKKNSRSYYGHIWTSTFEVRSHLAKLTQNDIKLEFLGSLSINPLQEKAIEKLFMGFTIATVSKEQHHSYSGGFKVSKKATEWNDFLSYPIYYQEQVYEKKEDGSEKPTKTFRKPKDITILNHIAETSTRKYIQLRKNRCDQKVIDSEKQYDFWGSKLEVREPEVIKSDYDIMCKLIDSCKHKFKMYDDVIVTNEDELDAIGNFETDQERRKRLGKLFCRRYYQTNNNDPKFCNIETDGEIMGDYKDKGGIIIYGNSQDNTLLKAIGQICRQGEDAYNIHSLDYATNRFSFETDENKRQRYCNHDGVVILKVANSIKDELSEFINVNQLFEMKHHIVKRWYTAHLIKERVEDINMFQVFKTLNEDLFYKWKKLHKLHTNYYNQFRALGYTEKEALVDMCKKYDCKDHKALEILEELEEYAKDLEIIQNLGQVQEKNDRNDIKNKELFLSLRAYLKSKNKQTVKFKKLNKKLIKDE